MSAKYTNKVGSTKENNDIISLISANMKILRKGKIKIDGDTKIYLEPYIEKSVNNTVCGKLLDIISRMDEVDDECERKINHYFDQISVETALTFLSITNPDIIYTAGVISSKKNFDRMFSFKGDSTVNYLYRVSTLPAIYQSIESIVKEKENESNDTNDAFVLYIPDILIYLDNKGNTLHQPYKVNLLITIVPTYKILKESEGLSIFETGRRYVDDLCDAALKCGVKNLVVDPFSHKKLLETAPYISDYWITKEEIYDMRNHIDSISYCVPTKYYSTLFKMSSGMKGFLDLIV